MSVYIISDLHLCFNDPEKDMSVFGGWENYTDRLTAHWRRIVGPDDTVVLGGDTSWALKLEGAAADFRYIDNLPGRKILIKGNHDLWWSTSSKLKAFFEREKFLNIDFVYNNCKQAEGFSVCGTRGWFYDDGDEKILQREAGRLERSLSDALATGLEPLVVLHYPPVYGSFVCEPIFGILKKYNIKKVYHGHIHGAGRHNAVKSYDGVEFKLISADCIDFTPYAVV